MTDRERDFYPPALRLCIPNGAILLDGHSGTPLDSAKACAARIERDVEQFANLAPTLGRAAQRETPLDVVIGVDPAFAGLVATTIVDGWWWLDGEPVGGRWTDLVTAMRDKQQRKRDRKRRRATARARKARRGWR